MTPPIKHDLYYLLCRLWSWMVKEQFVTENAFKRCHLFCVCSFAIWNTMMGTSILSIPWGIKQVRFIYNQSLHSLATLYSDDDVYCVCFSGWLHSGHHHYCSYGSSDALLLLQSVKIHKVNTYVKETHTVFIWLLMMVTDKCCILSAAVLHLIYITALNKIKLLLNDGLCLYYI